MTIANYEQFMHPAVLPHTPHEEVKGQTRASYGWMAGAAIIASLIALLYFKVLTTLAHDWWTLDAQSHGLLIPPLAFYIAWIRRDHLLAQPVQPDNRGVWLVLAACAMFFLGSVGAEFFLTRISFVILLAGLTWTFWGRRRLRALAFPLVLLATMVPLPALLYNVMAAPLQLLASGVASRFAQAVGITLFQDGNVIQLAHVSLGVAEACSGLHSLSALVIASLLLGYLHCGRLTARLTVLFLSIPLAIAVNVFRVTGTAVIADYNEELAMGYYHSFSGWLVFLGGFGALYLIAKAANKVL